MRHIDQHKIGLSYRGAQKQALCARALADLEAWSGGAMPDAAE